MNKKAAPFLVLVLFAFLSLATISPTFSQAADSWTQKATVPHSFFEFPGQVGVLNEKIYAIISNQNFQLADTGYTDVYDPATNTWTEKTPIPTYIGYYFTAACQNKIYVMGDANNVPSLNEAYDPATDTWTAKTPMPTSREWTQANVVDGKIFVIGGIVWHSQFNPEVYQINEVYDPSNDSWSEMAPIPTAVCSYASAVLDGKIYIFGGTSRVVHDGNPTVVNLVQIFDPQTNSWSQGTPLPANISGMGACATTGLFAPKRIYVFGGTTSDGPSGSWTRIYDPEAKTWSDGTAVPTAFVGLTAVNVNDMLYVMGRNQLYQYTPAGYQGATSPTPFLSAAPSPSITPSPSETAFPSQSPSPTPSLPQPTPTLPYPPSPIPSPSVPEFPAWVFLPLMAIAAIVLVCFKRRKQ
jgi:N-acetylneuraminic acid mutarotase